MFERIVSVLFPVFSITAIGFFVARRSPPDMSHANRLTADVFVPALIFGALAGRDFHVMQYHTLVLAMLLATVFCGVAAWGVTRVLKAQFRTIAPPLMFSNSINLGVPVAMLAFGNQALQPAIILFMAISMVHYTYGLWLLDHRANIWNIWRMPSVLAMIAGFIVSFCGISIWQPLVVAVKMLGDICIPLMLFSLGVRMSGTSFKGWHFGLGIGLLRPVIGMLAAWAVVVLLGLTGMDRSLFLLYGAMPPAVMNYIFAERFHQEPEKVASIVMMGNLVTVAILPLVLAIVL
ncbi:AEC family transporter [Uliginosibacterium gangwonense]|uniref:AEC family transporter n=1 Tax=Uliginosibacterium gangwonense TaxID=392736 RepID=UPI00037D9C01|nr:AEC family transporter [Uliginosibacterium gangwonense]